MRRKRVESLVSRLFCGAMAATTVWRCVWMRSRSQEWWDRDVNRFHSEFQGVRGYFKPDLESHSNTQFRWVTDIKVTWILTWLFRLRSHCQKIRPVSDWFKSELKRSDSTWFVLFSLSWKSRSELHMSQNIIFGSLLPAARASSSVKLLCF